MARKKNIKVGSARSKPGEWTKGTLVLGHFPDGPITSPVNMISGAEPGPTLWVQCAIHGTETGGAIGLLQLFKKINTARMKGNIVGIMATNPTAFRGYARNTPLDGENLNRLFPGNPRGAHSQQMASVLFETAMSVADAMMDLHSGGDEARVPFYGICYNDGSDAAKESMRLAESIGSDVVWSCTDAWLGGAMFVNFTKNGKPGIIVENGGGGGLPDSDIDKFAGAIEGVAKAMGILPGRPPRKKRYIVVDDCALVFNRSGGYFVPAVEVGDIVESGQTVGRVMDVHGETAEEITSPNGPAYIAAIVRPYLPVHSGTMVAECISVVSH